MGVIQNAQRDQNRVTGLLAQDYTDSSKLVRIKGDPVTGRLLVTTTGSVTIVNSQSDATVATWTSATALNTDLQLTTTGLATATVTIVETGTTTTAGAVTFEVYDGTGWYAFPGKREDGTLLEESSFTLINNTSKSWVFGVAGWQKIRVRLSTAITGTGSPTAVVTIQATAAATTPTPTTGIAQQLDQTNDSISAWIKGASYTRLTASGSIVSGACVYYGYTVEASTSGTLIVYDNTAASGNTIGGTAAQNLIAGATNIFPVPIIATTGLYATIGGTATINFLTRGISK